MSEKKKIYVAPNKPFILNDHEKFWMVTAGHLDLFYASISEDGNYSSSLTYIATFKKGEILFSLLTQPVKSGTKLLAVGASATLLEINKNALLNIDHLFLKYLIEGWIFKLAGKLHPQNPPRIYKSLETSKLTPLRKHEPAFPSSGLVWCRAIKGEISRYCDTAFSNPNANFSFPIPVAKSIWIKSLDSDVEVEVFGTSDVLKDEIFFMLALNDLQRCWYDKLIRDEQVKRNIENENIHSKVQREEQKLSATLFQVSEILSAKGDKGSEFNRTDNSARQSTGILETCQVIGEATGFRFHAPKFMDSYSDSVLNQLHAITQASKVRVRTVILRDNWWEEESGHMLAFLKEEQRPVALIQRNSHTYILKDVLNKSETVVTKKIAETLDPISYTFFYAFDEPMTSLKKVWKFAIQGVKKDAKFLIIIALIGSLVGLLVPVLTGTIFDDVIPDADRSLLVEVFIIMLLIGFVTALLQLTRGVLQLRVETKSNINLQAGLMDHLLRLPVTFYKSFTAGDLTHRALSINAIRQILSNIVITSVLNGAFSVVNLCLLFYYDSGLAWVGVGLALIAIFFTAGVGLLKLRYDRHIASNEGEIQGFLFEFLSGITKIRLTGAEKKIFSLWADKFSQLKKLGFKSGAYQNYIELFNSSYPLITNIFFFSFIHYTVTAYTGEANSFITVGAFMAFITAFNQFLSESLKMSMSIISSLNVFTLYERLKPILEEVPESTEQSVDPGELAGRIEFNSVSFRYHEDQPLVLNDVSFSINPGEMVAFVGPSGSGKSTIMRILLGFEKPELGSVYYDGQAFDSLNKDLVRRQIGVVLQNGALMPGSIYKNIVGNSELSLEDAWEAARMSGMEEDIKQMPMEMHTVISEGAGTFSGGQKQRLMIARAIAHKPRLMFMDEATSALDNHTQKIVSESLDRLQATRVIIAHRLSTVINADKIFIMDKGRIVESGSYHELMEKGGLFSTLAKRQIA
jgi:NHLM bacteriocin system ABC transporter ATP-binding protein